MVDFGKLRKQRDYPTPVDPFDIFLRLPKGPGIDDLWNSQAEALRGWFERRDETDLVIKLNTGGGKTLVGLLIAQSTINETQLPALYLCPNRLLRDQTLQMAARYGIQAVVYQSDLDDRFLSGRAIMVATYAALFNGLSKFGIAGGGTDIIHLGGLILDDAHTAFTEIRDRFTITIDKGNMPELYSDLTHQFRADFGALDRQGTFDDLVAGADRGVLEVPHWAWLLRSDDIRERVSQIANEKFPFQWPLIRDTFNLCHALISEIGFSITPMYPPVELFPTFADCRRRLYMSATVADDSNIVRTFNASMKSVSTPISPTSLAGVGERMILSPSLMVLSTDEIDALKGKLTGWVSERFGGVVVITPSRIIADRWEEHGNVVQGDDVATCVEGLVNGSSHGPYIFPNRYDGLDLPGDSCRLLVLDSLPRGTNAYDLYRAAALEGSSVINSTIAQRVEQGMGRGTRGAGDHCVVILLGKDLIAWISKTANLSFLTPSTRAQLSMGVELSRQIGSPSDLEDTMLKCLNRDSDWTEYYSEVLANAAAVAEVDVQNLEVAQCERQFFRWVKDGYYEKSIETIEKFLEGNKKLVPQVKGWLLQNASRAAELWENKDKAESLQRSAFSYNRALSRPRIPPPYVRVTQPSKQSERIMALINSFQPRRGYIAHFEEVADWLVPTASSNQFEESLKNLGEILGFSAQRPEREFGKGPDDLWIMDSNDAWIIEAKSRKDADNPLNKSEHGQLLEAFEWFRQEYPEMTGLKVVVHPNAYTTERVTTGDSYVLTSEGLSRLLGATRDLLTTLCSSPSPSTQLNTICDRRLDELDLKIEFLPKFLQRFQIADE